MVASLGDFIRVWIMMSLLLLAPTLECAPGLPPVRADLEASATEDKEPLWYVSTTLRQLRLEFRV